MTLFDFHIFGLHIVGTWYGLMYALGFISCFYYVKKYSAIDGEHMENLLLYVFFGVVFGGRIGYVLFYDPIYFFSSPLEVLSIWKGGMSFHGGAIGVILALIIFSYRYKYPLYTLSDPLVSILPLALGLGRIGNYLNNELLGFPGYTGPFAMIKNGISYFPSPLFQAFLEGILLLSIMQIYRLSRSKPIPGTASAIFLIGYGLLRICAEIFRLPDAHIGYLFGTDWITLGMIYTLPMIALGIIILSTIKTKY